MAFTTIQAVYDEARQALETGKDERAIGLSEHLLESFPYYLEAYRLLGEAHLNRKELAEATAAFERVLRADPDNIPVHVGLGVAYERQGNLEGAIREFEQAFEIKPEMAELRNQLLRLHGEAWGNENAHVRMKRAGLARMYIRGRHYAKAIQELQDVLAQEPQRRDMQVALAETLWRNQEEAESAALCREILAADPDVLKANLILGYLLLAAGNSEGRKLWHHAQELDPSQGVARSLFDVLPPAEPFDTKLEAFDEDAWRAAREAATRAIQDRERQEREEREERERQEQAAPLAVAAQGAGSWLDEVPSQPAARAAGGADDDDFLKSLLFGSSPSLAQPAPAAGEESDFSFDELDITPFSLDDIEGTSPPKAHAVERQETAFDTPAPAATVPADDDQEITPFSLTDLGLSADEIAAFNADQAPAPAQTPPQEPDELEMTPFSLTDLGLSADEIAAFNAGNDQPAEDQEPDELEMTPFSLTDLGLSADEIAAFNVGNDQPAEDQEPDELEMTPFSLTDLGLSADEIAAFNVDQSPAPASSALDDDPFASMANPFDSSPRTADPAGDEFGLGDIKPFSFDDWDSTELGDVPGIGSASDELPSQLKPFNLDQFDDIKDSQTPQQTEDDSALPASLRPFSLDELDLDALETESYAPPPGPPPSRDAQRFADQEDNQEQGGFSWQERSSRRKTAFGPRQPEPEETGPSIFDKMSSKKHIEPVTPLTAPSTDVELDDEAMSFFSHDDVELRDFENDDGLAPPAQPASAAPQATPAFDEPDLTPFSLAELGLSEEELAAFDPGHQALDQSFADDSGIEPFSLADFGMSAEEMASFNAEPAEPVAPVVDAEPDMTPFSLADLGLSEEEIAALNADLGVADSPPVTQIPSPPFSFDDLGSLEDEIESIESETKRTTGQLPGTGALSGIDPELTPFSLDDLGLAGDQFDQSPAARPAFSLNEEKTVYDELLRIGRNQGFVDLTDIIQFFPEPEAQAEEIDQVALQLHHSGIQIRDGDEIIDMDELAEEEEYQADDPDMTPFSLADLGLSDEEVAALDMGATAQSTAPAAGSDDEPVMTPFSLADLGLSDEEIAALDMGTADQSSPAPAASDDEPVMTPFSLADLGLSDEEIAALDMGTADQSSPAPAASDDEPVMTPFSLADLGLSDDEIAALEGGMLDETPAPASTSDDEPVMTPFSLADLGLSDEEIAALDMGTADQSSPAPAASDDEPVMTPFSLADLGLSAEEIAALDMGTADQSSPALAASDDEPVMTPFSLADLGLSDDEIASINAGTLDQTPTPGLVEEEIDLSPFSLEELGLTADDVAALATQDQGQSDEIEPSLSPFSLADLGLSDAEIASLDLYDEQDDRNLRLSAEELEGLDLALPDQLTDNLTLEPAPVWEEARQAVEQVLAEEQQATSDEPVMTPFSFEDLGLTDEEIAALNAGTFEDAQPAPTVSASAEPDMTPFSFTDLGLSAEEIAGLSSSIPEDILPDPASDDEPVMTPFSLADLGLSDDEISTFESAETTAVAPEPIPVVPTEPLPQREPRRAEPQREAPRRTDPPARERTDPVRQSSSSTPDRAERRIYPVSPRPTPQERQPTPPRQPTPSRQSTPSRQPSASERPRRDAGAQPTPVRQPERSRRDLHAGAQPAPARQSERPRRDAGAQTTPVRQPERPRRDPHAGAQAAPTRQPERSRRDQPAGSLPTPRTVALDPAIANHPGIVDHRSQLETQPDNHALRLAMARMLNQLEAAEAALAEYKSLIKRGELLEPVTEDLQDLIETHDEPALLQRLHRTLGDAYSKQSRWREAMEEYSWVLTKS